MFGAGVAAEVSIVTKSLSEWLTEGEALYNAALAEYQNIEAQLDELEARLAAKKAEVNQIAQVIGKPPVESSRRLTAQLVEDRANRGAETRGGRMIGVRRPRDR